MAYESEKMTMDVMERLVNGAYNEVTFKNALVCVLDWCNWYRCTHIHKDTKIGVNAEGVRIEKYTQVSKDDKYQLSQDRVVVEGKSYFLKNGKNYDRVIPRSTDDPYANGWYEYSNPSDYEHNWYEKIKTEYSYAEVSRSDVSYYDSPSNNGWYEKEDDLYFLSVDTHCTGEYYPVVSPAGGTSPRENDWYVKASNWTQENPVYEPTTDNNVVPGTEYFMCVYKKYYKQLSKKVNEFVKTTDTVVNPDKIYYVEKNVDHYVPENPSEWDYSDHYSRNIDITISGVENEITLQNKRPITL